MLVVVSSTGRSIVEGTVWIDLGALGLPWDEPLDAYDELTDRHFDWWGPQAYIRLDSEQPAHVVHLRAISAEAI